ncbi:ABC transporter substrate-binding protein [Microvirga vignae]|nr:ABC transporter substrate-binding protein [Microvirga vignae]
MSRRFEHAGFRMWRAALVRILVCALAVLPATEGAQAQEASKKVLHIDSYHAGNEWNDRIVAALRETLTGKDIELRVFHMDTKRRPSDSDIRASALEAKRIIDEFKPDVITTSDDPAAQHLVQPYMRDSSIPVVFCGLNWDASTYGLPFRNTTGMVEVSPIPQIVRLLRKHARGPKLGFLSEDTQVKRKELAYHERLFGITYDKTYFVRTHAAWKEAFLQAQKEVDMLMILGVGALPDWNLADATRLAEEKSEIPSGTDFEWLTAVSLIGVVKSPQEQGRWVGQATLRILEGVQPSDIPLSYNREGELFFNDRIARKLGIKDFPPLARAVR